MNEQEIIDAYNILAQNVKDQAARDATIIGNSQRSLGPLAARVASPTGQTSGLANYTYNRLMRPTVDATAAALTTQGTGQAIAKNLADALRAAKNAYEDAQNANTVAAANAQYNKNPNYTDTSETGEDSYLGGKEDVGDLAYPKPPAGVVLGIANIGNGRYEVRVSNGKGGTTSKIVGASSTAGALEKYRQFYPGAMTASEWQNNQSLSQQLANDGLSAWEPLMRFSEYINWDALGR